MPHTAHHHFRSVGSTLTQAWSLVEQGESIPLWLTADEQTAGRGRMDRHWISKPGNLYSTYVCPTLDDADALGLLPFAVSLSVYDAVHQHLPVAVAGQLALKWPNDVLIDGAKLSGILVEQRQHAPYGSLLAIGIGINVEHAPDIPGRRVIHLDAVGATVTPGALFLSLKEALAERLSQLQAMPQTILTQWGQHARGIGGSIEVIVGNETVKGTFDHLAADGALMVRLPSGAVRAIRTGDIVLHQR